MVRGGIAGEFGMGAVRVALLFGSAAVGLALILTPLAESQVERMSYSSYSGRLDPMATGAIGQAIAGPGIPGYGMTRRAGGNYTVRRSVLQPTPASVCVIRSNGMRTGDC